MKKIKLKLIRSLIGTRKDHRATVRGLGLRKLNSSSEIIDSPATWGQINKVKYLLKIGK